jgi:hypothetical protein
MKTERTIPMPLRRRASVLEAWREVKDSVHGPSGKSDFSFIELQIADGVQNSHSIGLIILCKPHIWELPTTT